jgi:PPK2 family polyphosphate:nucleotide phosphotransferase
MDFRSKDYIVAPDKKVDLIKRPTFVTPLYKNKSEYQEILASQVDELKSLQQLLYADNTYAMLLIFQAMDAAGKDGAIAHVMSGVNPQGCQVFSFKHPSATELDHDFLWRTTQCLPERGRIGIFNRSYYEEVLIVRVHPHLLESQGIPWKSQPKNNIWQERFRSIVDLESHLSRNGTRIIKYFLHLSKEEQRKRFIDRIDKPEKNWKFSLSDIEERKYWDQYQHAYQECLCATSTEAAPWYIVPADDKKNARLIISKILVETLKSLDMSFPKTNGARLKELAGFRKILENE